MGKMHFPAVHPLQGGAFTLPKTMPAALISVMDNEASALPAPGTPASARVGLRTAERRAYTEWWVVLSLVALLAVSWEVSQQDWIRPGDDFGYWVGVAGGSMLLLLLLYPLRKRFRMLQSFGHVKAWLWGHMVLGVGGPLLILVHCKFQASSLNAAAALYSMVVVAVSGVLGRFLYVRVNRGLAAEKAVLAKHRGRLNERGASMVCLLTTSRDALLAFEADALRTADRAGVHWFRLVLVLPGKSWWSRIRLQAQAAREFDALAKAQGWDAVASARRKRRLRREVVSYHLSVMRVALFAAWERLFSLWHVAHIPFVFLLVLAGVVHVVAVHAY